MGKSSKKEDEENRKSGKVRNLLKTKVIRIDESLGIDHPAKAISYRKGEEEEFVLFGGHDGDLLWKDVNAHCGFDRVNHQIARTVFERHAKAAKCTGHDGDLFHTLEKGSPPVNAGGMCGG